MDKDLVAKFQSLKAKYNDLSAERVKCEARIDQLNTEIKSIQEKYTEYDLSTVESVERVIKTLTERLNVELNNIYEQYEALKGHLI